MVLVEVLAGIFPSVSGLHVLHASSSIFNAQPEDWAQSFHLKITDCKYMHFAKHNLVE